MIDEIYIVFGHYVENGLDCFDVLYTTFSWEKKVEYIKSAELLGYDSITWGVFEID